MEVGIWLCGGRHLVIYVEVGIRLCGGRHLVIAVASLPFVYVTVCQNNLSLISAQPMETRPDQTTPTQIRPSQ